MATILVVDDEQSFRDELQISLSTVGHQVIVARESREAIEIGTRYRPDILITDWMLGDAADGLTVADALRLVNPDLRVILISGYVSHELERNADGKHVVELIEKPFDLKHIRAAVSRATVDSEESLGAVFPVGVIETDASGTVLFANRFAEDVFTELDPAGIPGNVNEALWGHPGDLLERSELHWVTASPFAEQSPIWRVRSRTFTDGSGRLTVFIEAGNQRYESLPAVRALLDLSPSESVSWPNREHVLIIDSDSYHRRRVAGALRDAGCFTSHLAETTEEGLRLLEKDHLVKLVVVGGDVASAGHALRKLKMVRPDISIVEC